jgi:hypothetical protein
MERRVNISLPGEVHTALRVYCVQRGKTMADVIVAALHRLLADEERKAPRRAKPSV